MSDQAYSTCERTSQYIKRKNLYKFIKWQQHNNRVRRIPTLPRTEYIDIKNKMRKNTVLNDKINLDIYSILWYSYQEKGERIYFLSHVWRIFSGDGDNIRSTNQTMQIQENRNRIKCVWLQHYKT